MAVINALSIIGQASYSALVKIDGSRFEVVFRLVDYGLMANPTAFDLDILFSHYAFLYPLAAIFHLSDKYMIFQ
jgi:hypothetical protein